MCIYLCVCVNLCKFMKACLKPTTSWQSFCLLINTIFQPPLFCTEDPLAGSKLSLQGPAPLVLPWGPPRNPVGAA